MSDFNDFRKEDLVWSDYFDNDREAGVESPEEMVDSLIGELENIAVLIAEGKTAEAHDELECQSGRIEAIMEALPEC